MSGQQTGSGGSPLMRRIAERRGVRQFVKFGVVGASGFVVNFLVFKLLEHVTPLEDHAARYTMNFSIAFLSGGVSNYFFNRIWTFRATGSALVQGVQFLSVSAVALLVGLGVSKLVSPHLGPGDTTWLLATLSGIVVNFFVNKYWTFRPATSG